MLVSRNLLRIPNSEALTLVGPEQADPLRSILLTIPSTRADSRSRKPHCLPSLSGLWRRAYGARHAPCDGSCRPALLIVQVLIAYAPALAEPARRRQVISTVTSGVVIGILSAAKDVELVA